MIASIPIPAAAGTLAPADERLNGPSGRALDQDFLAPIGVARSQTWLCDLVPHTCLNPAQKKALAREYEPRREVFGLPEVDLPDVPDTFADEERRAQIRKEIGEAGPEILVLLGDQPIRHFLAAYDGRWKRLAGFGKTRETYGRLHPTNLDGIELKVLPLAHPRQTSGLGRHSSEWKDLHAEWKQRSSPIASRD
jgi:uracil-DNA glycosylase